MEMNEEQMKLRIERVEQIINSLEHNNEFNMVIEDKKTTIKLCDDNWHRLDISNDDGRVKFLELKYAKIAADNIVNTIDIYKQELQSLKDQGKEQGYYEDE